MIPFVEDKPIDWTRVQGFLRLSAEENRWSNFGPVSLKLEERLAEILNIPSGRTVVVCNNGTSAIYALVAMRNYLLKEPLRWTISSFGFQCTKQGPLANSKITDCGEDGAMDSNEIEPQENVVLTNPFGILDNVDDYASKADLFICDSGSAFDALKEHCFDEAISLHHTKPWGFGEGGCIIVKKEYKELLRSILNFGFTIDDNHWIEAYEGNYKMSDVSASFILQRLENIDEIRKVQLEQYERVLYLSSSLGYYPLINRKISHIPFCVPLLHEEEITLVENEHIRFNKYYKPLSNTANSRWIYDHILCCPCHSGLHEISDKNIIDSLRKQQSV